MSINGDYIALADAVGEVGGDAQGWTGAEIDEQFDGDAELMGLVFENERYDAMNRLRRENEDLRARLAAYENPDGE